MAFSKKSKQPPKKEEASSSEEEESEEEESSEEESSEATSDDDDGDDDDDDDDDESEEEESSASEATSDGDEEETSEEETSEEETSEEEGTSNSEATSDDDDDDDDDDDETSDEEEDTSGDDDDDDETSDETSDDNETTESDSEEEESASEASSDVSEEVKAKSKKKKKAESSSDDDDSDGSDEDTSDEDDDDDDDSDSEEESSSEASSDVSEEVKSRSKTKAKKKEVESSDDENDSDDSDDDSDDSDDDSESEEESEEEDDEKPASKKTRGGKAGAYAAIGDDDDDDDDDDEKEPIDKLPKEGTDLEELNTSELEKAELKNVVPDYEAKHEGREWVPLEEDFYNLVFLHNRSKVLFFAIFFIFCQWLICVMYFYDLSFQDSNNRFGIPEQVPLEVTWAQFVALPLAIVSHKECRASWNQLFVMYTPVKHRRRAKFRGWIGTMFFRIVTGLLLVTLSFLLILNAETVPGVFLNLQTVVLVGLVDDVAYWLAQRGFLGKKMERATDNVPLTKMPARNSRIALAIKIFSVLIIWITMIALWAVVFRFQLKGVFLLDDSCKIWQASFGDWPFPIDQVALSENLNPTADEASSFFKDSAVVYDNTTLFRYFPGTAIGGQFNWVNMTSIPVDYTHISGSYKVSIEENGRPELVNERLIYYEELPGGKDGKDDPTAGKFSYCVQGEAWIYTIDAISDRLLNRGPENEDCPGWLLRSPQTLSYSLDDVALVDGWRVWTGSGVEEADDFSLECANCKDTSDCNFHGECVSDEGDGNVCACDQDFFGVTCEFGVSCDGFNVGAVGGDNSVLDLGTYQISKLDGQVGTRNEQDIIRINGRPVYTQNLGCPLLAEDLHQVGYFFYSSGRWYHGSWKGTDFCSYAEAKKFPDHAMWGGLLSSPLHFQSNPTRKDSPGTSKTESLTWSTYVGRDLVDVELDIRCL